jgi:hypothetical protein
MRLTVKHSKKPRRIGLVVASLIAIMLLAWERGWLSNQPTYRGRTVTQWLDKLALYEYQYHADNTLMVMVPRAPDSVAQDPAYHALLKIGSRGLAVYTNIISRRAEWSPSVRIWKRGRMWVAWRWHQLLGAQGGRPAPSEWAQEQTARKTAAGFALVALGTNAGGGFSKYIEVYASAPKHQTVYGTRVAGAPVGVSSLDVVRSVALAVPERREEVLEEVLKALEHTNALYRCVALECAHAFRGELLQRRKEKLVRLTRDEDPLVQQAALGHLLLIAQIKDLINLMPPSEIAQIARTALNDSTTSERLRSLAQKVLNLATNR